jgi:hypothetical protein
VHLLNRASLIAMHLIDVHPLQACISQAAMSALKYTYRVVVREIHCGFHAQFTMGKASDPVGTDAPTLLLANRSRPVG